MNLPNNIIYPFILAISFSLSSCSVFQGHKKDMEDFDKNYSLKKCDFGLINNKMTLGNDTILWGISGGALARHCKEYKKSNILFDQAEVAYKEDVDKKSVLKKGTETSASLIANNNINPYSGRIYERIMTNTLKALNFASLGDNANARIEFNRALERQRRAKYYFKKEIKEQQQKIKQEMINAKKSAKEKKQETFNFNKIMFNKKTLAALQKQTGKSYYAKTAQTNFINPFVNYIAGLYFYVAGDNNKARNLLKETRRLLPRNKQVASDYRLAQQAVQGNKKPAVWVVYANGKGVIKEEMQITLPIFLVSSKAFITPIALPKLKSRQGSYKYLLANGKKSSTINSMDDIVTAEFNSRFKGEVTMALLSATLKTISQYYLSKEVDQLAGLAAAVYSYSTATADVRHFMALPKNFQSVRVTPKKQMVEIKDPQGQLLDKIKVPKGKSAIIYVRSTAPGQTTIHTIFSK